MSTTEHTDDAKVSKLVVKILKLINKSSLNIPELLVLYGNLGYHIGASMTQTKSGEGPTLEELKRMYYTNPTVDVALMIQGLQITDWEKDFIKSPKLSKAQLPVQENKE